MKAMILAAGFGTRLWPLTVDRTKPAIPFLNKPLIVYSVEYLKQFGITEMVVNLHHQGESVQQALGDGSSLGVKIRYSIETEILGTSGAIDHARKWLEDDTFIVMNGKVITDIDLNAAITTHQERSALATLVLKENTARERFSRVILDNQGNIEKFGTFPDTTNLAEPVPLMFTGIQILAPEIFNYIPRQQFSHSTTDVYPQAIVQGRTIAAHISAGNWYELSTLARYLTISNQFLADQGKSFIADTGTTIAEDAQISESVLWKNVRVAENVSLKQVIVGDNVTIPANTKLAHVVVVRRDLCTEIEKGEIVGENLIIPI